MKKNKPLVSLIIVNWNGKKYLSSCLRSLSQVTYRPIEIIVVDQNSSDGSQPFVKKNYPNVMLIENETNTGYVGGNNLGVTKARGKYAMILNNDIEVDKNFLQSLVAVMEKDKRIGCVQPKALNLRHKGKLDGGGSLLTRTGFLYHKGFYEDASNPEYNKPYFVYSVKGAYMFFRRELFMKLGGLDRDFFIYFEESDFCGRLWVAGYTVKYIPTSIVYHWGGGDTSKDWEKKFALVQYRSFKNRLCSYIKNMQLSTLIYLLPVHLAISQVGVLYYLFTGKWRVSVAIEKAIGWNIIHLPSTSEKRRLIQKMRKASDSDIFSLTGKRVSLGYYLHGLALLSKS